MKDKFAVIGASSFTGRALVALLRNISADVQSYSRPTWSLSLPLNIAEDIHRSGITHVVNFAALNMVAESWTHQTDYYQTNLIGVAALCRELHDMGWRGRFIQVSTPEVYGKRMGYISEGAPFAPSTPYAVSRAAIDMHLRAMAGAFGFRVLFTRSCNVYGPGQQLYRIIPKTVLSILRGQKIKLHGGGASSRAWLHADDAATAIHLVALNGEESEDYHIAEDNMITIRYLVRTICDMMGHKFEDCVEVSDERPGKDLEYRLDHQKIRRLGWRETRTIETGLRETVDWFVEHAAQFEGQPLEYTHNP